MVLNQEFERLDPNKHFIKNFDCAKKEMNEFLAKFAVKHAKQGISSTMVLTFEDESLPIPTASYFTLAAATVNRKDIPSSGLPSYPIPVTLLARLAVDVRFQKKNIGVKTLIYALRHALKLNDHGLNTHGLVLDVLDTEALSFYKKFNFFQEFLNNPMKLFVSMKEIQRI